MLRWNRALLSVLAAGLLWAAATPVLAQPKETEGKKADAPPAGKVAPLTPPTDDSPAAGEPGMFPDGAPQAIPSLEYNYYYPQPGAMPLDQSQAQLYLCPLPYPPPYVGHTYITYPPFQPHEWLWIHARAYYRIHPGGGATMTTIRWERH